ncbi:MAG: hypothetical protein ACR2RE_29590, partial [Geminicoccaceae bacterium]
MTASFGAHRFRRKNQEIQGYACGPFSIEDQESFVSNKPRELQLHFVSFWMADGGYNLMIASPSRPEPDEGRTGLQIEAKLGKEVL